jgi:Predicted transcriptional regulators
MDILIRNSDSQPIYEQIYTQIRGQILSGALRPGDPLPSIRSLARDLRISVITTKRAYDELEADGFLATVAGKGSFVAEKDLALVREMHLLEIEEHLQKAAELAGGCGLSRDDLLEMLRLQFEESGD